MGRMSLFAIGITELRDMFGAAPELADRLRAIAETHFPPAAGKPPRRGSLLGRIGPVLKKSIETPQIPDHPVPADADALLAGRTIVPERLGVAWQIVLVWLDEISWGRLDLDLATPELAAIEFELAKAGLPSQFALERLLQGNPQLPLRPLPGQQFGYAKNPHVEATRHAVSTVIGDLEPDAQTIVQPVLEFLNRYPGWTAAAAAAGRPVPDLVVVWTP